MTPQQNACLIAIRDLTVDGISPTFEEVQFHLGLSSKSAVHRLVHRLISQGHLKMNPRQYRSLEIVERGGGAGISEARIAVMSDDALESAIVRMSAALSHRRALSQGMREMAA